MLKKQIFFSIVKTCALGFLAVFNWNFKKKVIVIEINSNPQKNKNGFSFPPWIGFYFEKRKKKTIQEGKINEHLIIIIKKVLLLKFNIIVKRKRGRGEGRGAC